MLDTARLDRAFVDLLEKKEPHDALSFSLDFDDWGKFRRALADLSSHRTRVLGSHFNRQSHLGYINVRERKLGRILLALGDEGYTRAELLDPYRGPLTRVRQTAEEKIHPDHRQAWARAKAVGGTASLLIISVWDKVTFSALAFGLRDRVRAGALSAVEDVRYNDFQATGYLSITGTITQLEEVLRTSPDIDGAQVEPRP